MATNNKQNMGSTKRSTDDLIDNAISKQNNCSKQTTLRKTYDGECNRT